MSGGPKVLAAVAAGLLALGAAEGAAAYNPIKPAMAAQTVMLTGHDLTIEQVIAVARGGAKVALSPEARQRSADNFGLLLEGAAEGIPIYRFNRGAGAQREVVVFTGDPMSPANKALVEQRQLTAFQRGARGGYGPEVEDEETVRAMMVVRANTLTYASASPALTQMLIDLINNQVTPMVRSGGTVGEGDLSQIGNLKATMVGVGDAYFHGQRMTAAEALRRAGLKPLAPTGADEEALDVTNAYSNGEAVLLVDEARRVLEWAEMAYAIDLNGLNSSVTPMSRPVQIDRPFAWLNWESTRILDMIRGSYLFEDDPKRIIQDPESMRATPHRTAAAWQAWAALRAAVVTQMNSSEQNPDVRMASPGDSWELATPHFERFHIKGGPYSNGKSGYVLSNANWDPYPLANEVEAFSNALANLDVNIDQRQYRFTSTFFTVILPSEAAPAAVLQQAAPQGGGFVASGLWQEISVLTTPIQAQGDAIVQNVEDLQGNTHLKVVRARKAVDLSLHLIGQDLLTGTYWMDIRRLQSPNRAFGGAATAAWTAFRKVVPWQMDPAQRPDIPPGEMAYRFMKETPVSAFYTGAIAVPAGAEPATPWLGARR